jgi:ABC-type dipeptide/oligopeptide/nickel transport system permease subunit
VVTAVSVNLIGDWLRDLLDPQLRRRIQASGAS